MPHCTASATLCRKCYIVQLECGEPLKLNEKESGRIIHGMIPLESRESRLLEFLTSAAGVRSVCRFARCTSLDTDTHLNSLGIVCEKEDRFVIRDPSAIRFGTIWDHCSAWRKLHSQPSAFAEDSSAAILALWCFHTQDFRVAKLCGRLWRYYRGFDHFPFRWQILKSEKIHSTAIRLDFFNLTLLSLNTVKLLTWS